MNKPSHEYCKECKDWNGTISNCMNICGIPMDIIEEWEKYHALGTVEELREAGEKQRAKKPVFLEKVDRNKERYLCGYCGMGMYYYLDEEKKWKNNRFCPRCGQKFDWSEEE